MNYERLINRIKQKDNSAIMEFYNKFYKEVYYVCYKITENEKDAEDVAQETLIKAIDKIDTKRKKTKNEIIFFICIICYIWAQLYLLIVLMEANMSGHYNPYMLLPLQLLHLLCLLI